ncbi:hypothetical protein PanNE5_03490 [Pandoraea sp. NE5]|uniref:hypothetical protein n=1 Tax=Pandoraea sp. NE5 TaxID=2904129 RepID=UPI0021C39BD9|nr:hypothetical protein [Pandoraea sp. NE5]BDD90909.1 hypothetical protein PanNE5_03490 [Pandoraea sp. NE5]
MSKVTITVSGRIGSGKSALCGEIEIMCKALGLEVEWQDGQAEKNLTHADWTESLEMYKPSVEIVEKIESPAKVGGDERDAFEAHPIIAKKYNLRRDAEFKNKYENFGARCAWEGWQARAALSATEQSK